MQKNVLWLIFLLVLVALMGLLFRRKAVEEPVRASASPSSSPSALPTVGGTPKPYKNDALVLEVDLVNNRSQVVSPGSENLPFPIKWIQDIGQNSGVVQVSLPPDGPFHRARFVLSYNSAPKGISFNVADSASSNGYGGDAGTQSNDAELQIDENTLLVYGNDSTPGPDHKIGERKNFIQNNGSDVVEVADQMVFGRQTWKSPNLFCLSGQPDKEGPVNYDIFVGFNQVVNGSRRGSGLSKVLVELRP